jgi:hypothetical protein
MTNVQLFKTGHVVKTADRARITCGTCGDPATKCSYSGISYFYYCDRDFPNAAGRGVDVTRFRIGERVTTMDHIYVGSILVLSSQNPETLNTLIVTEVVERDGGKLFRYTYLGETQEFAMWDFEFATTEVATTEVAA